MLEHIVFDGMSLKNNPVSSALKTFSVPYSLTLMCLRNWYNLLEHFYKFLHVELFFDNKCLFLNLYSQPFEAMKEPILF